MRPSQARFVTCTQQLLAIGAVLAVLGPAANVVSLDVVIPRPGSGVETSADQSDLTRPIGTEGDRRDAHRDKPSRVETAPVEPVVTDVPMPEGKTATAATTQFVSEPQKVEGFGTVGVTWSGKQKVDDDQIEVLVRTRDEGDWSGWAPVEYHDDHGPDPDSREGRHARQGTDPLIVGDVDEVQAKAITAHGVEPVDLSLAVVEPGKSHGTDIEEPAIDTAELGSPTSSADAVQDSAGDVSSEDAIALQAGSFTPKPQIYSRAQWGANERMRDPGSLHYFEVHAGFVHHTVNANDYTRDEVPGILRSIYAYHTQTRGWSDVGYNFLVDRFGRIWEGRYGGVDRPVVGAHTLGYNDYSFAMSAIGNFETVRPSEAMLQAYGRLFAWKLSLHGVDASSLRQQVGPDSFPAINGHRDAAATACPGRYLYARLATIREYAANAQADWSGRDRATSIVAGPQPDLLVRRASDGAGFVVPTNGLLRLDRGVSKSTGGERYDAVVASPDLTGDRVGDIVIRRGDGVAGVRAGTGTGAFAARIGRTTQFAGLDQITAVGDLNGDGKNDLVARNPNNGKLFLFRGRGDATFSVVLLSESWAGYQLTAGSGDLNGDGLADVLSRDADGRLWLHAGTGRAALATRVQVPGDWSRFDVITGFGDYTRDGSADLFVRSAASGRAYVYPGKGNGRFRHWLGPFGRTAGLTRLSGAPLVGTREPDLVGVRGDELVVVRHHGTQHTLPRVPAGRMFADATAVLNVGDWDRDGAGDVVTRVGGQLLMWRGLGGGEFAAAIEIGTGFGTVRLLAAVGDTTGDGWPDLMGQPDGGALRIYPGRGLSGLKPSFVAHGAVRAVRQLGVGRWDGDGAPDNLFRDGDALKLLRGNGPGGLTGSLRTVATGMERYDWVLGVGDVTGDGRPDLIVRERTTGYLWVLPGSSTGLGTRKFLADGYAGYDLAG